MEFEIMAKEIGFRGIGYYPKQGFMHIDLGPERSWGTPFKRSSTRLTQEPEKRESVSQSKTVQAAALQMASGLGTGVTAMSALDGTAQIALMALAGVIVVAALFIFRERIKAWSDGWQ
jgi:hypothetical protein